MKSCSLRRVREANLQAAARVAAGEPMLYRVERAAIAIPGMRGRMLLHAGPPVAWSEMCAPMRVAIAGAVILEGWAAGMDDAFALMESGAVALDSAHHRQAVGPMTGVISPSMYVLCVKNVTFGNVAYSNLNEGLGRVLRFGAYGPDVLANLTWVNEWIGSVLQRAIVEAGPVPLKPIMREAVRRGDECHNRHQAGNKLFIDFLRPWLMSMGLRDREILRALEFIEGNYYFFLNVSLAACKAMADAAAGIPYSTMVWALARNGRDTGIRVSGLGKEWFRSRSAVPRGKMFDGHDPANANPDMGDSTITETVGLGAFAMAAAPEIVSYLGGRSDDVIAHSKRMYEITVTESPDFKLPTLGNRGSPLGIDVLEVCDRGITPIINTGIAHADGYIGQIGAGYVMAPPACFAEAKAAFERVYGIV